MFLFVFICLNIVVLFLNYSEQTKKYAFVGLLAILFIEPVFQKLTDSSLFGSTFLVFGFDRIKTNIVFGSVLLLMVMFPRSRKMLKGANIFIFAVIIFHLLNVLFSINQQNSFAIFIVGILVPICFYKALTSFGPQFYYNNDIILQSIYLGIIIFIGIGLVMFNKSGLQASDIGVNRVGGSIWLSNVSTQILAVFFPLLFINNDNKKINFLRIFGLLLYLILLIVSVSRTALIVYLVMAALFVLKTKNKVLFICLGVLGLFIFYYVLVSFFNVDIINMYSSRFEKTGSVTNTIESDARGNVFREALNSFADSNIFLGNGLSTFNLVNSAGYSNAHNIVLNILVERGLIGLGIVVTFFYTIFKRMNHLLSSFKLNESDRKIITAFRTGLIGYLLIGMTGNDLFINSGFINGWPLCCIIVSIVVIEAKLFKYKSDVAKN
ncbi:O-antigen ligase family protein [Sphingobacterium faecium]|uniref:O-antigen ligase family protein n=1 Tax=Sphingobacterium faecium TaxID=34087 RepID=UPI003209801B